MAKRELVFHQKIGYRLYDCYLNTTDDKQKYYEAVGERTIATLTKENQSEKQLFDWFFELAFGDFKKEILSKRKS